MGGHKVNLISVLSQKFKCPFCNLLMRDVIQTYRGERACQTCYYDAKEKGNKNVCPIDKEPITDREIFEDNFGRKEILKLPVYCNNRHNGCVWEGVVSEITEHELKCLRRPIEFPCICGKHVGKEELYNHLQNCSKIAEGTICPYQSVGCKWAHADSEENLDQHMQMAVHAHAVLTISTVEFFKASKENMSEELMVEQRLNAQLSKKIEEFSEKFNTEVDAVKENQKEIEEMRIQINQMETKAMSTQAIAIGKIEESSAKLTDLELKLQLLEQTCYDGHQLWKIDNVKYRMDQAVTGILKALYSAPFYQRRGEYKFCSRLDLNGDGEGRGTHVSLFIAVMKSEYDELLQWPFSQRVTFRLINPYNQEESLQKSIIPDRNSSSFQRPTRDMNIPSGCPMFILKEDLARFIINDVLYIEITITPM